MTRFLVVALLMATPAFGQTDHADVVRAAKARLLAQGENLSGACGAFKITSAVAWEVRGEGWGLVHSDGNGCSLNGDRYRTDTLMLQSGLTVDLLGRAEDNDGDVSDPASYNLPQWGRTGDQSPLNWRRPLDPVAPSPGPAPAPAPVPAPTPAPAPAPVPVQTLDLSAVYIRLSELASQVKDVRDTQERIFLKQDAQVTDIQTQVHRNAFIDALSDGKTITAIVSGVLGAVATWQATK